LAEAADALILSVDSRQALRGLDVGTAKPPAGALRQRHRLLDLWDPAVGGSAEAFARAFWREAAACARAGRRVLAVGGSGLYLDACLGRLDDIPPVPAQVRERLRAWARGRPTPELHAELTRVDPATARRLKPGDRQRILRALEVHEATGRPLSHWQRTGHGRLDISGRACVIVLVRRPEDLRRRIRERCEAMVREGLEEEVRSLVSRGLGPETPALRTLGYREWRGVVTGAYGPEEGLRRLELATWRYARRQMTWFRNRYRGQHLVEIPPGEPPEVTAERVRPLLPPDWGRLPWPPGGGAELP
jgi:tRNA dimethylallyltransferase